ncbi:uncharacterized protein H6S33_007382 [Morchella sextelata]|uniref:uncharacterized protein n=1 Tax=Morchella sextelata TaxID=1174677 RepID=UPI001D055006|nr:uncharacterized protein H6S33_007382 [Morchella sextelata]KAH0603723.1 hypothetical protein H6S33_007382 [Morchella sextelata]
MLCARERQERSAASLERQFVYRAPWAPRASRASGGGCGFADVAGKRACELELPPQVKIHNVFHIELLEHYRQSSIPGREQRPPTPKEVDKEGEVLYEVESIVGSWKSRRGLVEYLVKWRGYSMSDCTYQVLDAMNEEVLDLVRDFHRRNPKAVKDQRLRL